MRPRLTALALVAALLATSAAAFDGSVQDGTPPVQKPDENPPKPAPPAPQDPAAKPKPEVEPQKSKSDADSAKPKPEPEATPPKDASLPPKAASLPPKDASLPAKDASLPAKDASLSAQPDAVKKLGAAGQGEPPIADRVVANDQTPPPNPITPPPAQVESPAVPRDAASTSKPPLKLDGARKLDASGYAVLVERLVLEFPDLLRAQSLGKSRAGRDLWLLTASDVRFGDPSQKPALCVCCELPTITPTTISGRPSVDVSRSAAPAPAIESPRSTAATPAIESPRAATSAPVIETPRAAASVPATDTPRSAASALATDGSRSVARAPAIDGSRSAAPVPGIDVNASSVAGPEAALFLLAKLLADSRTSPELATLLQESTIYVLPAIDPEQACAASANAGELSPRACRLDRNFPVDWQPWGDEAGAQGPYPLSEPESQCVALFLAQRSNLSAVVVLTRDGRRLVQAPVPPDAARDERDERACERVCAMASQLSLDATGAPLATQSIDGAATMRLHPPAEIVRHGGDFTSYCEQYVGLSVFTTAPWSGASVETSVGSAPAGFEVSTAFVERLLKALPRLATDGPKVERLRNNLWMIDIGVHNLGILPTLNARLRGRGAGPSVSLKTSGAKLVAAALRRGSDSVYEALRPQDGGAQIGHLEGDESINLRLLVEAAENTSVELTFESQRAGSKRVKVALQ